MIDCDDPKEMGARVSNINDYTIQGYVIEQFITTVTT